MCRREYVSHHQEVSLAPLASPCLTGKTKVVMRTLKYDGAGEFCETHLRPLDGVEYFSIMGWSKCHWRKVSQDRLHGWNTGDFTCTELLLNIAGNAFSPYSWIAVQMSTRAVHGHFLKQYSQQHEVVVKPEAEKKQTEDEPKVRTFDDSSTSESEGSES